MKYVLSIDQSTQGTKALIFDENGAIVCRCDRAHKQLITENGWVSHDPIEIYDNLLLCVRDALEKAGVSVDDLVCMGISNQRETTVVWDKETGEPVCDAIVWQCGRASKICQRIIDAGHGPMIQNRTGIPVSPFYPASKMAWILENNPGAKKENLCFGTIDTWLIYKLTGEYKTDYSNASRTQLFNLNTLSWDEEICDIFGLSAKCLAEICDSDSVFGLTDLGGLLSRKITVCAVLGDSHAALFGQGCLNPGMTKATYGTGSSVMMNIGERVVFSEHGLVTSLAWKRDGKVAYVLEGNINYTGAVVTWLKDDVMLIDSATEVEGLAKAANPADTTYLVPAFTGLGAPYWNNDAKAVLCGLSRLTGKAEIVKAALECIAYQITDITKAMERDTGCELTELCVDGGPTRNAYLMQFQSDILGKSIVVPDAEELSGIGAGYLAGIACGVWTENILQSIHRTAYCPAMERKVADQKYDGWMNAVRMVLK